MKFYTLALLACLASVSNSSALADFYQTWPNGGGWVSQSAHVAPDAYISSFCMIGDGVTIGARARLVDSTIQGNVVIGADSSIERSQLQGDVQVGKSSKLTDSQVQGSVVLGDRAVLQRSSVGGELSVGAGVSIIDSRVSGMLRGTIGDHVTISSTRIDFPGTHRLSLTVAANAQVQGCKFSPETGLLATDAELRIVGSINGVTSLIRSGTVVVLPSTR